MNRRVVVLGLSSRSLCGLAWCLAITISTGRSETYKSRQDGPWSDPDTWGGEKCLASLEDTVVIKHPVTLDRNVAVRACKIGTTREEEEKAKKEGEEDSGDVFGGAELVLKPGKTLTVREELDIAGTGLFSNEGGTVRSGAPLGRRFTLKISGKISSSGNTRIVSADILWDSDQKLSSLYGSTPEEDQLKNTWTIVSPHTLTMDMDASVACILLGGEGKGSLGVERGQKDKPLRTLKFANVPHGAILSKELDLNAVSLGNGMNLLSFNHNGTGDWWLVGDSRECVSKLSDVHAACRFGASNDVHLRNVTLILDEDAECRDLTVYPDAQLKPEERRLTVHGKKVINEK